MIKKKVLILFLSIFLISLTSASPFGYDYLEHATEGVTTGENYSINVNNSNYLQGYTPTTLKDWIQGLFDSVYVKITDVVGMVGNWSADKVDYMLISDWNATNTSYVPYTGANQNVNLGDNNLSVGGTDLFVDSDNGRVGIGTTTPLSLLHLNGGVGSLATGLSFGDGNTGLHESSDDVLKVYTAGIYRLTLDSTGIRIASNGRPQMRNEVPTATNPVFLPTGVSDVDTGIGGANPGILSLITEGVSALYIDASQNVGIGTSSSQAKLHVNGNILANGTITTIGYANITGDLNQTKGNATINMIYGEMWYHNHTATPLNFAVDGTYYNLTFSNSLVNGMTFNNTGDYLKIDFKGVYQINYMASGDGQNNHVYYTDVTINGVVQDRCESHKKMTAGGDIVTMNGNCLLSLNIDDKVKLATADIGGTGTGNYYSANLNLVRIGN